MDKIVIYRLVDPLDFRNTYVGKTNNIKKRYSQHLDTNKRSKKSSWIKSLKKRGVLPVLEVIDEVSVSEWKFWEQHYISLFKSWGFRLMNLTNGGEGPEKFTEESKRKMSQKARGFTIEELERAWKKTKGSTHNRGISKEIRE